MCVCVCVGSMYYVCMCVRVILIWELTPKTKMIVVLSEVVLSMFLQISFVFGLIRFRVMLE